MTEWGGVSKGFWLLLALIALLMIALIVVVPFFITENAPALALFGLIITFLATLASIIATRHYSNRQSRDDLTRYGLQAWRNLDALAIKVTKQLGDPDLNDTTLEEWTLDIDQAKWAWRDLLREAFDLQKRLELETEEVAARYKEQILRETDPALRAALESKQRLELAKLSAKAPLPLRVPVQVKCPNCQAQTEAMLGEVPGESAHVRCPTCETRFAVHRDSDGSVFVGGGAERVRIDMQCPQCQNSVALAVPWDQNVEFIHICPTCKTHIKFIGNAQEYEVEDLGKKNATMTCPHCGKDGEIWISPDRSVQFLIPFSNCSKPVQVIGNKDRFSVEAQPVRFQTP